MKLLWAVLVACLVAAPSYAQLAPPNAAGLTYGHVHLNVKDIEVHKKLWVEHFGGVVVTKGPLTTIKFPGMLIALTQKEPTGGSMGTVMDHFGFKVQNLADILAKWRAAGLPVTQEFTGAEGFPNAYLMGPDNVRDRAAGGQDAEGKGHRLSHSLHHARLPGAAEVVRRHVRPRAAQARNHRNDRRCAGHEPELPERACRRRRRPRGGRSITSASK